MKFGKRIRRCGKPEWSNYYVNYKYLKQQLKLLLKQVGGKMSGKESSGSSYDLEHDIDHDKPPSNEYIDREKLMDDVADEFRRLVSIELDKVSEFKCMTYNGCIIFYLLTSFLLFCVR